MRKRLGALLLLAAPSLACATALPPAPDPALEPGRELYAGKCHGCHRLYTPSKIDSKKWPSILDKMAVKAKLSPEEAARIDAYVTSVAPK